MLWDVKLKKTGNPSAICPISHRYIYDINAVASNRRRSFCYKRKSAFVV